MTRIRDAAPSDYEIICTLNLAEVQHTSPMDAARLAMLGNLSCYHKVACVNGSVSAFLLSMCNGAPFENDNFAWFARKYTRFIYVDRIVVSSAFRGLRLGSLLYQDLFRYARDNAIPVVTCEYNIVPPNEPSRPTQIECAGIVVRRGKARFPMACLGRDRQDAASD
jgi:uncharacterized protein